MKKIVLMSIVAVLAISSIFLTIESATIGMEVSKLEKTEAALSNQKRDLEEVLVRSLSNSTLQEKSTELGFIKPIELVYVSQVAPVAKLP